MVFILLSYWFIFRFAFIEFGSEDEVKTIVENTDGYELGGQTLTVDYASSKSKNQGNKSFDRTPNKFGGGGRDEGS